MLANEVLAHGHKRKGLPRSCPTSMELALPECLPGLVFDFKLHLILLSPFSSFSVVF